MGDILLAQCALTLYLFYLYLRQSLWSAAKALKLSLAGYYLLGVIVIFMSGDLFFAWEKNAAVHSFSSEVQMSVDIFRMKNAPASAASILFDERLPSLF